MLKSCGHIILVRLEKQVANVNIFSIHKSAKYEWGGAKTIRMDSEMSVSVELGS